GLALLHNLTINLPRLAYESNRDETYFRAKLAILLQTAINAMVSRKEMVMDSLRHGILPAISQLPVLSSIEDLPLVVNLVGLREAVSTLVSEKESALRQEISVKTLETASKVASEKAGKLNQRAFISMVEGEGSGRLADLDSERYGRSQELRAKGYHSGVSMMADQYDNQELINNAGALSKASNGGCFVSFEFPKSEEPGVNVQNLVASMSGKIPFVHISLRPDICTKCGMKVFNGGRCNNCKSTVLIAQALLD
ncbi:MAG: anaerobic ribonucleoside-triphosphate reductase, partial [Nitrososphaerales archaeon]